MYYYFSQNIVSEMSIYIKTSNLISNNVPSPLVLNFTWFSRERGVIFQLETSRPRHNLT